MSHDGSWRDSCAARGMTDHGVGSGALLGVFIRSKHAGNTSRVRFSEIFFRTPPGNGPDFQTHVVLSGLSGELQRRYGAKFADEMCEQNDLRKSTELELYPNLRHRRRIDPKIAYAASFVAALFAS